MADLQAFTMDRDAIRAGEWVPVGTGDDQFEIKTRGFTQAYRDGLNRIRREAARDLNRKLKPGESFYQPDALPPSLDDKCQGQALADHCVLDVRGLNNGGTPVTVDQFRELIRDPRGGRVCSFSPSARPAVSVRTGRPSARWRRETRRPAPIRPNLGRA
jgi:hypothetical protein